MINKRQKIIEVLTIAMEKPEIANALIQRVINELNKIQPEPEPVAYQCREHGDTEWFVVSADAYCINTSRYKYRALYIGPPQREWVGLTEEEMAAAWSQSKGDVLQRLNPFARAIEAKLKEKNG